MRRIIALSGGLSVPSSSLTLAGDLAREVEASLHARGEDVEVEIVQLRDHAHAIVDNMLTGFPTGEFAELLQRLELADGLVVVSPTFCAGMSGLVKSFFDVIEPEKLTGTPVLLAATGGTERHSLVIEFAMRPLFSYLKAVPMGTGVYAATSDFGEGAAGLRGRVGRAAEELADAVAGNQPRTQVEDQFVDFETLLGRR